MQWSIGCALLPLTAMFFAQISLVGPAVNLVAIPWFSLVLVPATLCTTLVLSGIYLATVRRARVLRAAT